MSRPRRITDRPEWPDVLKRLEELAEEGVGGYTAANMVADEFEGFSGSGILSAMRRGAVPCYPSKDPDRVAAWEQGDLTYRRSLPCNDCGGWEFYTADGRCVACCAEYNQEYHQQQKR